MQVKNKSHIVGIYFENKNILEREFLGNLLTYLPPCVPRLTLLLLLFLQAHNLFVDAFLHNNRLEHMIQVMGYHPQYLEAFLKTQQYILRGDGPLSYDYRHYIAIMVSDIILRTTWDPFICNMGRKTFTEKTLTIIVNILWSFITHSV